MEHGRISGSNVEVRVKIATEFENKIEIAENFEKRIETKISLPFQSKNKNFGPKNRLLLKMENKIKMVKVSAPAIKTTL